MAEHILKLHRYRAPGESEGSVLQMGAAIETLSTFDFLDEEANVTADIYEKNKIWCSSAPKFVFFKSFCYILLF